MLSKHVDDEHQPKVRFLVSDLSSLLVASQSMFDSLNDAVNEVKHLSASLPNDSLTRTISNQDSPDGLAAKMQRLNALAHRMSVLQYANVEQEQLIQSLQEEESQEVWRRFVLSEESDMTTNDVIIDKKEGTEEGTQTTSSLLYTRYVLYFIAPRLPPLHRLFKAVRVHSASKSFDVQFYDSNTNQALGLDAMALCVVNGPLATMSTESSANFDWETNVLSFLPTEIALKVVILARRKADRRDTGAIQRVIPPEAVRAKLLKQKVVALLEMDYTAEMGFEKTILNKACYEELSKLFCTTSEKKKVQKSQTTMTQDTQTSSNVDTTRNSQESSGNNTSSSGGNNRRVLKHNRSIFDDMF